MSEWAIPVKTKTVHEISSFDLDWLVNDTYFSHTTGVWDFVANEECGNDSDHKFSSERELFEPEGLTKFQNGDVWALQWATGTILWDLANKGLLPKGDILVIVCW